MKAFSPIKLFPDREVMPLEAETRITHAAVQMAPALPDRIPDRAFGEHWSLFQPGFFMDVTWALRRSGHGDNVSIWAPRANSFRDRSYRSSGVAGVTEYEKSHLLNPETKA